jgi:hypothetical protein
MSFAGVTAADARWRVLSFLICEFVKKDLVSTAAHPPSFPTSETSPEKIPRPYQSASID